MAMLLLFGVVTASSGPAFQLQTTATGPWTCATIATNRVGI